MQSPTIEKAEPIRLDSAVRSWLSLLLFIHLFVVAIALSGYTQPSGLQQRLKNVLGFYLTTFNFDLTHSYYSTARLHLTHGNDTDVDFAVIVDVAASPENAAESVTIPPEGLWPPQRYRRYQALANAASSRAAAAEVADEDPLKLSLPGAIAASVLAERGAKRGTVKCRGHYLQSLESLKTLGKPESDPYDPLYYRNVLEADVFLSRGKFDIMKKAAAGEVAPVETSGSKPASSP